MKNKNVKPVIICLSNQFFDLPLKTNKHLVMQKLADRGYKVIFVDPPTRFKFIKNFFKTKKFSFYVCFKFVTCFCNQKISTQTTK